MSLDGMDQPIAGVLNTQAPHGWREHNLTWDLLTPNVSDETAAPNEAGLVSWAVDTVREHFGESWLRRQWRSQEWIPPELLYASTHRWITPQLLSLASWLGRFGSDPSLASELRAIKRGCDRAHWRHFLLQLEVARAAVAGGGRVSFEPILGSGPNKADVLIEREEGAVTVEVTTTGEGETAKAHYGWERALASAIGAMQRRYGVHARVELRAHAVEEDRLALLRLTRELCQAVSEDRETRALNAPWAHVVVEWADWLSDNPEFEGVTFRADAWMRSARTLADKARQSRDGAEVWIRLDARDGLFQLTDWSQGDPDPRLHQVATLLRAQFSDQEHLGGFIVSSGKCLSVEAVDHCLDLRIDGEGGSCLLLRTLASHLARQTLIVPLTPRSADLAVFWADAYDSEPMWLADDARGSG